MAFGIAGSSTVYLHRPRVALGSDVVAHPAETQPLEYHDVYCHRLHVDCAVGTRRGDRTPLPCCGKRARDVQLPDGCLVPGAEFRHDGSTVDFRDRPGLVPARSAPQGVLTVGIARWLLFHRIHRAIPTVRTP